DRDMPMKLVQPATGESMQAIPLTVHNVVMEAHRLCQPVKRAANGELAAITLPDRVAKMYLDMVGDWRLPPLAGVSTSALLGRDGSTSCGRFLPVCRFGWLQPDTTPAFRCWSGRIAGILAIIPTLWRAPRCSTYPIPSPATSCRSGPDEDPAFHRSAS